MGIFVCIVPLLHSVTDFTLHSALGQNIFETTTFTALLNLPLNLTWLFTIKLHVTVITTIMHVSTNVLT